MGSVCKASHRKTPEQQEVDSNEDKPKRDYYDKLMEALTTPAWDGYASPNESDENCSPKDKKPKKQKEEKMDTKRSRSRKASKTQQKEKEKNNEKAKKESKRENSMGKKEKKKEKK